MDRARNGRAVALIAPVSPFRGGIARHSSALARALATRADVRLTVETFSRLYPAALYPGASDRDPDAPPLVVPHLRQDLDTLNPWTWRRTVRRLAADRPDLVVLPAWTFFVAPCLGSIARGLRRRGVPVSLIVHNAEDHEAAAWKRRLSRYQLSAANRYIVHTQPLAEALRPVAEGRTISVCPHPAYDDYPPAAGDLPRRAPLELLCFGLVRRYKGVDLALEALAQSGRTDVRLTIAGEVWEGRNTLDRLIAAHDLGSQVEIIDRYVSDAETAELMARADAVLAPYRSVTGSGVVALAQHYGRPVVASALPGLRESVADGRTGWLFPSGDAGALASLLRETVSAEAAAAMRPAIAEAAAERSWDRLADALLA